MFSTLWGESAMVRPGVVWFCVSVGSVVVWGSTTAWVVSGASVVAGCVSFWPMVTTALPCPRSTRTPSTFTAQDASPVSTAKITSTTISPVWRFCLRPVL